MTTTTSLTTAAPPHDSSSKAGNGMFCGKTMSKEEVTCCKECTVHDQEEEAVDKISFEDQLHNVVYIKRTPGPPSASSSSSSSSSTPSSSSKSGHRHERSITGPAAHAPAAAGGGGGHGATGRNKYSAEANLIPPLVPRPEDPFTERLNTLSASSTSSSTTTTTTTASATSTSSPPSSSTTDASTNETVTTIEGSEETQEEQAFSVRVNATDDVIQSFVISGLKYFYVYDVRVTACHDPNPATPSVPKLCSPSTASQRTIQTLMRRELDHNYCLMN